MEIDFKKTLLDICQAYLDEDGYCVNTKDLTEPDGFVCCCLYCKCLRLVDKYIV